jgi:cytochrome c
MRSTLVVLTLVGSLAFVSAFSAWSQSPPDSPMAKQIVATVDKAASLIDAKGKSVFPEFRQKGSEWFNGDLYLFVADNTGLELFNAAFPKYEGVNTNDMKDPNGKLVQIELIKMAQQKGSGWVDYLWPKPGQSQPSQKWAYVKAVKIDGTPGFVGAGFYLQ